MKTFAQWVLALTRGYIKATGKEPDKLAKLKINMEAGQKVKTRKKLFNSHKRQLQTGENQDLEKLRWVNYNLEL